MCIGGTLPHLVGHYDAINQHLEYDNVTSDLKYERRISKIIKYRNHKRVPSKIYELQEDTTSQAT